MFSLFASLCVALCLINPSRALPKECAVSPTVTISAGTVSGVATSLPGGNSTVNKYLGVPYALPPKRFSPPEPIPKNATKSTIDATQLPASCIQQFNYPEAARNFTIDVFGSPLPASESEDCLYLNIFTPSSNPPEGGRAVMFWIYGGNLQFGWNSLPAYDGSTFAANQDVIVVTINYRTNVFGYPNAPQLSNDTQNLGFFDQRLALSWVQENIACFGGDPTKVTIFGESAGGYSVKQLVAVPPKLLPFRAAIMESEAVSFSNGTNSWETLIAALNCSTADEIACARAAPASTIKSIIEHGALSFGPVVDGTTRAENVTEAIVSGTAADIPILIGSNANEGSAFAAAYGNLSTFLAVAFPSAPAAYLEEVTAAYPRSIYPTDLDIISQINTEVTFQCAAATIANLTTARGLPVYRYYYNGTFPNTQPFPGAGAFHSSEISEVFGTYNKTGATTQEITLSNYMKTAWANFAKNPEAQPQPSWPRIGSTSKDLLTLQSSGRGGGPAVVQYNLDFRCQLYAPVYQATGL